MDKDFQLKIADFGFAHTMKSSKLYTECGTTGYMAPEMFNTKRKGYDGELTDVWACGVILFIMKAGFPPYQKPARTDWWFDKLMKKKYDRFWMAHCRTATFSDELKDLINSIFSYDPKDRITVDGIMKHKWYNGETLDQSELTRTLSQRKAVVDRENAKLKQQQEDQQSVTGFGAGTMRAIGDEDDSTIEDAASDELPDEGPPSIILRNESDKKDDDEEEEHSDGDGGTGGFEEGMEEMTMEDTSGVEEKKEEATVYNPVKISYSKFDCSASPEDVFDGLKEVLDALKVKYSTEGYAFTVEASTLSGSTITFTTEIFKHPEDSDISVVECTRGKGDSGVYRNFYAGIRNKMDAFAREAQKS